MSAATPQPSSRRGKAGRHRSANFSRGKDGAANKPNNTARQSDKSSEPNGKPEGQKPAKSKAQNDGEKLVVRRLPPGMTEEEFVTILGSEWEVDKGKVDWFDFVAGGISKDLSKPPTPGRAYLHLMRKDDIMPLNDAVRSKTWEDAKNTFTNTSLVGPPSVEFCLYKKVPGAKKRVDSRQGTIDQDPEFQAFLESLANPVQTKDVEAEFEESDKADAKVTSTPLVEFLKEKKAKSKENAKKNAKGEGKSKGTAKDDDQPKKKGKANKEDKVEAPKEPVKILTKKAASEQAAEAAKAAAGQINGAGNNDGPKSRRAGIAAAARLLQRDLGLSPGSAHRKARQEAAKAGADSKTDTKAEAAESSASVGAAKATTANRPASPAPSSDGGASKNSNAAGGKSQQNRRTRGAKGKAAEQQATLNPANPPMILKKKPDGAAGTAELQPETPSEDSNVPAKSSAAATKANGPKASQQRKAAPASGQESTRAFVKHANPSQGVTDAALKQSLEAFGPVTFVEMDKRKGFAYVDFADRESLAKAIAGSPVAVGQGTVQVLERKEKKPQNQQQSTPAAEGSAPKAEKAQGRGRRGRGGGNKNAAGEKAAAAAGEASSAAAPAGNGG
ncbi:Regulator of nonsense transcripts-like protein [Emericellopsis cladophorae]|uniref:Regulator of nonsense transcripts-like protein n=1 Tax=Emericellopsis cladophorae TaxID=2686198 RepID=A0A9P9Y0N0_9HYPO|nr:Regulator of nonsense transcripts-like protein [Emericellopsis cladophorae]KAI6781374.1 Regulator of nonsense transcripts-like protein [Emericellopsis cladophorae]